MTNSKIQYLIFDLDDTVYTNASGLFAEVGERIEGWVARALDLSPEDAQTLRQEYFSAYGTTMSGLLHHHPELDIDDYLDDVHCIDISPYLRPSAALRAMLERLPVTKAIFTNAIADWAEKVLGRLGIRDCFSVIIDVRAVDYWGKPHPGAYERALEILDVPGDACIFVDDQARNLRKASEFGMRTVLVRPGGEAGDGVDYAVDTILDVEPIVIRLIGGAAENPTS